MLNYDIYIYGPPSSGKTALLIAIYEGFLKKNSDMYSSINISDSLKEEIANFLKYRLVNNQRQLINQEEYINYIYNAKNIEIKISTLADIKMIEKINNNTLLVFLVNPLCCTASSDGSSNSAKLAWDTFVYWLFRDIRCISASDTNIINVDLLVEHSIKIVKMLFGTFEIEDGILNNFKACLEKFAVYCHFDSFGASFKHICYFFPDFYRDQLYAEPIFLKHKNQEKKSNDHNPMHNLEKDQDHYSLASFPSYGLASFPKKRIEIIDDNARKIFLGQDNDPCLQSGTVKESFMRIFNCLSFNYYQKINRLIYQTSKEQRCMVVLTHRDMIPEDHYSHLLLEGILDDLFGYKYDRLKRTEFLMSAMRRGGMSGGEDSFLSSSDFFVDEYSIKNLFRRFESFINSYLSTSTSTTENVRAKCQAKQMPKDTKEIIDPGNGPGEDTF